MESFAIIPLDPRGLNKSTISKPLRIQHSNQQQEQESISSDINISQISISDTLIESPELYLLGFQEQDDESHGVFTRLLAARGPLVC